MALLLAAYAALCVFVLAHLYPAAWTLLPAYVLLGATMAPAFCSKWSLVVFFASRISCGQQECGPDMGSGSMEQVAIAGSSQRIGGSSGAAGSVELPNTKHCGRDERIRRLARWYHAAENGGIIVGAVLAAVVMTQCGRWGCEVFGGGTSGAVAEENTTAAVDDATASAPIQTVCGKNKL